LLGAKDLGEEVGVDKRGSVIDDGLGGIGVFLVMVGFEAEGDVEGEAEEGSVTVGRIGLS